MKPKVVIVGAGMTGLAAAYRLRHHDLSLTILEQEEEVGGLVRDLQVAETTLERTYHHIFASDNWLLKLLDELGLAPDLHYYQPQNGLLVDGQLHAFTTPLDLLRFSPLSLLNRLRTGLSVLQAGRLRDWQALEGENAARYLIRKGGQQSYDKLWQPLLRSKFGEDADQVSAVWMWNKFKLRGGSRDKSLKNESLGYLKGGFGRLTRALAREIESAGQTLRLGETVQAIEKEDGRFLIQTDQDSITADRLIFAAASPLFISLTKSLNLGSYREEAAAVRYKANLCLIARFREPVTPYYWTTIADDLPFVVAVEQTRLLAESNYGAHILYLSRYLDRQDALWQKSDSDVIDLFLQALFERFPAARSSFLDVVALTRSPYSQPVIPLHYSRQRAPIRTPEAGLYLASMAQIYPEDRGLNYACRLGYETADSLLEDLHP